MFVITLIYFLITPIIWWLHRYRCNHLSIGV